MYTKRNIHSELFSSLYVMGLIELKEASTVVHLFKTLLTKLKVLRQVLGGSNKISMWMLFIKMFSLGCCTLGSSLLHSFLC